MVSSGSGEELSFVLTFTEGGEGALDITFQKHMAKELARSEEPVQALNSESTCHPGLSAPCLLSLLCYAFCVLT